ncbi:MAG: hypothetical protein K2F91_02665 [Muribaculaceae bacterium]|nr:hypothetical protein [Muribaculaceae bacterium]MDE6196752.1 hypothetical protein [Muribaculaceae bacterium]
MKTHITCRNEDFRRRCLEIFEKDFRAGAIQPLESVIDRAIAMQPRSHYLNYDQASRRLHAIERHGLENEVKEELARQMWSELRQQIDRVMELNPKKPFDKALSFVLNFCRPSRFYISRDTARRIIAENVSYSLIPSRNLKNRI